MLRPKTSYSYTAIPLKDGREADEPYRLQVTTLDTTSHQISWVVDTLGVEGIIRDVWVFDQNHLWAVGEIEVDTGGQFPERYNGARWDGTKWNLLKIPTELFGGSIATASLHTVFAFRENDLWVFSSAGSYSRWNGSFWETKFVAERSGGGNKLWGTSSSNLFLAGTNGSISHFNGSRWEKMESGTTVDLEDIWGIDERHIWAAGYTIADGRSVIVFYDGSRWSTLYDNTQVPSSERLGFSSVWTNNATTILATGVSGFYRIHSGTRSIRGDNTGQVWISYRVRGCNTADVFTSGAGGEILHFNGSTWFTYTDVQERTNDSARWLCIDVENTVIVTGGFAPQDFRSVPVVARGLR
jgi:hypothetical protein